MTRFERIYTLILLISLSLQFTTLCVQFQQTFTSETPVVVLEASSEQ